ncbi:MAG: type II secretion system protein, partial [Planctomycetota bacterium]
MKCMKQIPHNAATKQPGVTPRFKRRSLVMHRRTGFTLIELLVVIAIIALL